MNHILDVLNQLEFLGPSRFAVGGCVRDYVMGVPNHDVDVATELRPGEVWERATLAGYQVVPTGIAHGTVTILLPNEAVEVTTFRRDNTTDGRHAKVEFGATLGEDLARRDFTMNAMAITPQGLLLDPYMGQLDIQQQVIDTVGDPMERFKEDYLRILRMYRFSARFGFEINPESNTADAAMMLAPLVIAHVSIERIVDEFSKAFAHEGAGRFVRYAFYSGILPDLIPQFRDVELLNQHPIWHPEGSVLQHVADVVDRAPARYRWHALLHDIGKKKTAFIDEGNDYYSFHGHEGVGADMIPEIGKRLKLPNALIEEIEVTTRHHMQPLHLHRNGEKMPSKRSIRRFQVAVGEHLEAVEAVVRADRSGRGGPDEAFLEALFTPLEETEVKPVLMGRHLIQRGCEPGPHFSVGLKAAYEYQIEHGVTNVYILTNVAVNAIIEASVRA
jgi:putative nucleotidyltransferase with HDIG domain